jgi:hypothetical protein
MLPAVGSVSTEKKREETDRESRPQIRSWAYSLHDIHNTSESCLPICFFLEGEEEDYLRCLWQRRATNERKGKEPRMTR